MTLNDKSKIGEVVIVQRPHRGNYKVFQYGSLSEAFETWIKDVSVFCQWDNFSQVEKELFILYYIKFFMSTAIQ